jgi:PAS domain S-box-containing protein
MPDARSLSPGELPLVPEAIPTAQAEEITAEALRLISERSELVLNAVDEGVYCLDAEGRTIFVNDAGARMLGYSAREMLGRPQHELVHYKYADGSHFPREACPISASVTDGVQQRVGGDIFWRKDGTPVPIDYTSIPIKDGRRVLGAVVTFRDISAQQRADEQSQRADDERSQREALERATRALAESEERTRALAESVPVQVWSARPDGSLDYVTPRVAEYFGVPAERVVGEGWQGLVHDDDLGAAVERWMRSLATGGHYEVEFRLRRADGAYRWHLARAVPRRGADGAIVGWVGTNTDIHDRREAAAARDMALREAQRARQMLHEALEQAPAAISTSEGPEHRIVSANAMYQRITGGRELVGRMAREAFPELEGQPFFDLLDEVYRTGVAYTGRAVPVEIDRTGTGRLEPAVFDFVYQPLRDEAGAVVGILTFAVERGGEHA